MPASNATLNRLTRCTTAVAARPRSQSPRSRRTRHSRSVRGRSPGTASAPRRTDRGHQQDRRSVRGARDQRRPTSRRHLLAPRDLVVGVVHRPAGLNAAAADPRSARRRFWPRNEDSASVAGLACEPAPPIRIRRRAPHRRTTGRRRRRAPGSRTCRLAQLVARAPSPIASAQRIGTSRSTHHQP